MQMYDHTPNADSARQGGISEAKRDSGAEGAPNRGEESSARWAELTHLPDDRGHFGPYGGLFVAETLIPALEELKEAYAAAQKDPQFVAEFEYELKHYVGRPSPVYHARRWSELLGGAQIYLKREDLNHTGAHKVNNCIGQAMLARRMGKPRVIAETGAGQHGVATATVAARYGMECVVYMGSEDVKRQAANVYRMKLLGATVVPVESGSKTLKDALNEAMRDWVTNVHNTFYIIGTVAGPHPYPMMVRDFQAVIGKECIEQMPEMTGRQPDYAIAAVGGGSNAMGLFHPYIPFAEVKLVGVEAAGEGLDSGHHAASLERGRPGVLHGNRTYLLQDEDGQIIETHSISAGLDYPGVGPEHAWLKDFGRAEYVGITDAEALQAFHDLCRFEGIIPALESSHALAYAAKLAPTLPKDKVLLVNLSGRGDKDMHTVAEKSGIQF
ncbi:MAG: tryptophan synthase subunit beta [Azospira sp.]|jgi:tryptophan synthase beta chain|nr:tryptophan synthase subunit beta [Azospira sp.]